MLLRKPVDRVKRAQSKIYEDDDINIWDDESKVEDTLVYEPNGQVHTSKQPIRTRYLGHVTGYQPIIKVEDTLVYEPNGQVPSISCRSCLFCGSLYRHFLSQSQSEHAL